MSLYLFLYHPVIESYFQSDWIGKILFLSLLLLSVMSWTVVGYKYVHLRQIHKHAVLLKESFQTHQEQPLSLPHGFVEENMHYFNPFFELYLLFKQEALQRLKKNHLYLQVEMGQIEATKHVHLSPTDLEYIAANLSTAITHAVHRISKELSWLSLTVTLAPFLGLLGTVWGILMSFANMQSHANGNDAVLAGIAMALGTTVVGLVVAVPALIGYHYLKGALQALDVELEEFSMQLIAAVEMQYRKVDALR